MANRRLFQFLYSRQPKLTMVQGQLLFRTAGRVVGSASGVGVYAVQGYGNGNFQIKLTDNYANLVGAEFTPIGGVSAAEVNVDSLAGSSSYQIAVVGNSTWSTVGVDTDYGSVAIGDPFVATAVAGSGTGFAKLISPSNVASVEVMPSLQNYMTNTSPNYGSNTGGIGRGTAVLFKTLAPSTAMVSSAAVTTMAVVNPVASSGMLFKLWFRDSSATP